MIARTRVVLQEKDVIIIDPASARAGGVFERDVARSTILVACRSRDYSMAMSYTKIVLNWIFRAVQLLRLGGNSGGGAAAGASCEPSV